MELRKNEVFKTLSRISIDSAHVDKKGKFSYISWARSFQYLLDVYPTAEIKTHTDQNGRPWFDWGDAGAMVHVEVIVEGISRELWHPIMDNRNNAIKNPDVRKVNDSLMRAYSKCISKHGLGLYIYQGEDVPQSQVEELIELVKLAAGGKYQGEDLESKVDAMLKACDTKKKDTDKANYLQSCLNALSAS